MESGVIYYEYEKREKYEDFDEKANADLGTIKISRYHFDDESFVHPLHSDRFDPDRSYEIPIESLLTNQPLSSSGNGKSSTRGSHPSRQSRPTLHYSPRRSLSTRRLSSSFPAITSSSLRRRVAGRELRPPKSWELISPSEGWMYKGDEEEKKIGGMEHSVEKDETSKKEEEEEEEEDPEEKEENPKEKPLLLLCPWMWILKRTRYDSLTI
ncbi:hypothetical protein PIB30_074703 [Stylosanthes scabra]|uniref:Uncharacterized protein n=1 Tax=Stylosanthes scabra TaxID=79078 RepID=A0ABU6WQJ5_9FABA|nr:hypothetical protein [Stylosanthes scabra]